MPPEAPSNGPAPHGQPAPLLPEHVVVVQILTRVPAAAVGRFRTVCRSWRDALTSEHFVEAHRVTRGAAAAAAVHKPEIVFFASAPAPAAAASSAPSNATAFYTCKLNLHDKAAPAHELVTVGNLSSQGLAMSATRPCRGLALLHSTRSATPAYHVFNLSTGEHVSLPLCAPPPHSWTISSAGLGFDPAASEHKVVRLVPPHAAAIRWCTDPRQRQPPPVPVFVDGRFYWHVDARAILSLAASTEEFSWVDAPGRRPLHSVRRLSELDGSLCAMVEMEPRLRMRDKLQLWTRAAAGSSGGSPPSWSMRCRISFYKLPCAIRDRLCRGRIPIATLSDGKILLANSGLEVYAYDPATVSAERVFDVKEFVEHTAGGEPEELLNFALHEDSVTGVRRRPVGNGSDDDDGRQLKVKHGSSTLARREAYLSIINPQTLRRTIDRAMVEINNRN